MTNVLALMTGIDLPYIEAQAIIHQPKLNEIAYIGEETFFTGIQYLCIDKRTIQVENRESLKDISNFNLFMNIINYPENRQQKIDVLSTLTLFFPKYKINFTPRSILLVNSAQKDIPPIMIDETNFEALQHIIQLVCCLSPGKSDQAVFNPGGKQAQAIADKIMKARKKVAELKATQGESSKNFLSTYISSFAIGNSISLSDVGKLTIYQLYDQIERLNLYTAWDLDTRVRLAGGSPNKEPDNWMKNIH